MVLTRINLKLIKCVFWLDFILFHFFKENNKKMFFFMASYLLFWKNSGDMIHEKFKKKKKRKNSPKTSLSSAVPLITFLVRKTLKFGFLYFYKSCRELNFLSKKHQSRINWNFEQQVTAKIRNRCRRQHKFSIIFNFLSKFQMSSTSNLFKPI